MKKSKGLPMVTEAQFEKTVKLLAKTLGWAYFHPFLSKWSERGFPDVTLVRVNDDGTAQLCFFELKSDRGQISEEQQDWLDMLGKVPGVVAKCVRPSDWEIIVSILQGR